MPDVKIRLRSVRNVYYSVEHDNFYREDTGKPMGQQFYAAYIDEIRTLLVEGGPPPTPEPQKREVLLRVALWPDGTYVAYGSDSSRELVEKIHEDLLIPYPGGEVIVWVKARIVMPPPIVVGYVVDTPDA